MKAVLFLIGFVAFIVVAELNMAPGADAQAPQESCLLRVENYAASALVDGSEVCRRLDSSLVYREFDSKKLVTLEQPADLDQAGRFLAEEQAIAVADVAAEKHELAPLIAELTALRASIDTADGKLVAGETLDALIKALSIISADAALEKGTEVSVSVQ